MLIVRAELIDDTCGGTLGAIYSIFLAALTTEVRRLALEQGPNPTASPAFWGEAAKAALETLKLSTAARVGHRTVMDSLIPFAEALATEKDYERAYKATKAGGEGTAKLTAKLGRATYVNDDGNLPPDPGAMSFVFLVKGMLEGLQSVSS